MTQEAQPTDVAYGEIHKRLLSGLCKEDMIKEYANWASFYDKQCVEDGADHKHIAAGALIEVIEQTDKTLSVLDAACGTGMPGEFLKKLANEKNIKLNMTGVDFSPDMLKMAEEKKIYSELLEADLSEELPFSEPKFDLFMAVALFLDGHCGPEVLPNIVKHVKPGGLGVITVRRKTFEKNEKKYLNFFEIARVTVVKHFIADYLLGVEGHYIVLKKME